jgi:hypothetical protein
MDSFREGDVFPLQSASALPFNVTSLGTGNYLEKPPMQSCSQEVLQPHPGLGGRKIYSKEQWEAQKPIIKQLYIAENMSFKDVIDILRNEHNFFPTYDLDILLFHAFSPLINFNMLIMMLRKRQFYRKINDWGFEKNIKDKEMRTLIQDLVQRANTGEDLSPELRGRQVDPVKVERWRKRHGRVNDVVRLFPGNPSTGKFSRLSENASS